MKLYRTLCQFQVTPIGLPLVCFRACVRYQLNRKNGTLRRGAWHWLRGGLGVDPVGYAPLQGRCMPPLQKIVAVIPRSPPSALESTVLMHFLSQPKFTCLGIAERNHTKLGTSCRLHRLPQHRALRKSSGVDFADLRSCRSIVPEQLLHWSATGACRRHGWSVDEGCGPPRHRRHW